jgi:hypothetical protein
MVVTSVRESKGERGTRSGSSMGSKFQLDKRRQLWCAIEQQDDCKQ